MGFAKRYFQIGMFIGAIEFMRLLELAFPSAFASYGLFLLSFLLWIPMSAIAMIYFIYKYGTLGWVFSLSPIAFGAHLIIQFVLLLAVGRDKHPAYEIVNQVTFGALYIALNLWLLKKQSRMQSTLGLQ
ncbi:MAG TPA: hypothetical protein V6C69_02980 [Trichormus sp.]|jgi:hypothetical protein